MAVGATPAAASPAPPPAAPPGLTGEVLTMTQPNQDGTNVDCVVGSRAGSARFAGSGFATGPYSGTFTVNGTVSTTVDTSGTVSGTFDETFTITSPAGTVTGIKSGALPADTSTCIGSSFAADNAMLRYQATIATAEGNFVDSGASQALLEINTYTGNPLWTAPRCLRSVTRRGSLWITGTAAEPVGRVAERRRPPAATGRRLRGQRGQRRRRGCSATDGAVRRGGRRTVATRPEHYSDRALRRSRW